jgi:glycosyltransferase involved in cell wall biosynthesis
MAAAAATYLDNPAERMFQGEAARRHIEDAFAIEREVAAINAVYQDLLESRK